MVMVIRKSEIKSWSKMGTRATFGLGILRLFEEEPDFYVMSADLCQSSGLERFRIKYPNNFINVGIAEQNLIGVAAGLAKDGTAVYATSFAPFISMRASEQIRMNMGYMGMNVKAVGLGSGLAMARLGASHYGIEDISVMRSIPNIVVLSPADCMETIKCIEAAKRYEGGVYIRLTGESNNPMVYQEDYTYQIGKANLLKRGEKVALIATGTMVYQALCVAQNLERAGIDPSVIDMHTIKPLDTEILDTLEEYDYLITVEEHSVIGGLGGAVAEYMGSKKDRPRHLLIGIEDFFPHAGDYEYLLKQCGLTVEQITDKIMRFIKI